MKERGAFEIVESGTYEVPRDADIIDLDKGDMLVLSSGKPVLLTQGVMLYESKRKVNTEASQGKENNRGEHGKEA